MLWWLGIGFTFAAIAAVMAFLISYEEWSRHRLPRGQVVGYARDAALATFVFFCLLFMAALLGFTLLLHSP